MGVYIASSPCQRNLDAGSQTFFKKKVYGHSGTIFAFDEDSNIQIQYFCDFLITCTICVIEKTRFKGDKYCICDREITNTEHKKLHPLK